MPVLEITPKGGGETEGLRLPIELAKCQARLGANGSPCGIDVDALHARQIDHQPTVANRLAGDAVAAAADRDQKIVLAPEANTRDYVRRASASRDDGRSPIDASVVNRAGGIIAGLPNA